MADATELLGVVTCPSGALMIVDFGLLGLWSHERPPLLPEWMAAPEVVPQLNAARDYRVEGNDAHAATLLFGKCPGYLYDRPAGFAGEFADRVASAGLDARLVEIPRTAHRERIDRALTSSSSGTVEFYGAWAPCLTGLPRDQPMAVEGTRLTDAEFGGRWSHVELRVRRGTVAKTESLGDVPVDEARLGFFDVDAIGAWSHEDPIDDCADFVFWGRDAEVVAHEQGAPSLGDGCYGWRDLDVKEAAHRGEAIEARRGKDGRLFATDFRPHSHHFHMLAQVRATPTKSGELSLGGADVCGFMTSWGDGIFPVEVDRDAANQLLAVRILLGTEQTKDNLRAVTG